MRRLLASTRLHNLVLLAFLCPWGMASAKPVATKVQSSKAQPVTARTSAPTKAAASPALSVGPSGSQAAAPSTLPDVTVGLPAKTERATLARAQHPSQEVPEKLVRLDKSTEMVWIRHRVKSGDTLSELARRYKVSLSELMRWNRLKNASHLKIGQTLKVQTKTPVSRSKSTEVPTSSRRTPLVETDLSAPNPAASHTTGNRTAIAYLRPSAGQGAERSISKAGSRRAVSVGSPNRGRILHAVQVRSQGGSHVVRDPEQAWASTHTYESLQRAFAAFRQRSRYSHELVVQAISLRNGGRFRPHKSHQSGRDVDIRLPVARGVGHNEIPDSPYKVDWVATWQLFEALLATGEVEYIFLDFRRQRSLQRAAIKAGVPRQRVSSLLQWPSRSANANAFIRHSPGHTSHFHVRFRCANQEKLCQTY